MPKRSSKLKPWVALGGGHTNELSRLFELSEVVMSKTTFLQTCMSQPFFLSNYLRNVLPKNFNKTTVGAWLMDPYKLKAAWTLFFLYRLSHFTELAPFKVNSANCKFTFLDSLFYNDTYRQKLFAKFVPPPTTGMSMDNVLVDNINGIILNALVKSDQSLRFHFMTYVDSFPTYISALRPSEITWPLEELSDVNRNRRSPFYLGQPPLRLNSDLVKNYCSMFLAIDGLPLSSLPNKDEFYKALGDGRLSDLFRAMHALGSVYGMTHNDLHMGNVFYDKAYKSLRLIDYGRMSFHPKALVQDGLRRMIVNPDAITQAELSKYATVNSQRLTTYASFMEKEHLYMKAKDGHRMGGMFSSYMYDVGTLSMNIMFQTCLYEQQLWSSHVWDLNKFCPVQMVVPDAVLQRHGHKEDVCRNQLQLIIHSSLDTLIANAIHHAKLIAEVLEGKDAAAKRMRPVAEVLYSINEGLLWYGSYMHQLAVSTGKLDKQGRYHSSISVTRSDDWFTFSLSGLAEPKDKSIPSVVWYSFQVTNFQQEIQQHMDAMRLRIPRYLNANPSQKDAFTKHFPLLTAILFSAAHVPRPALLLARRGGNGAVVAYKPGATTTATEDSMASINMVAPQESLPHLRYVSDSKADKALDAMVDNYDNAHLKAPVPPKKVQSLASLLR